MKILMTQLDNGTFVPSNEESRKALSKNKHGNEFIMEYKAKRNPKFHRKLFALLNLILQNQEYYKSIDNILEVVKFRARYFETIVLHNGNTHYKAKSISFSEMDNVAFEEFYSKTIDVALELTRLSKEDIEEEILRFM